LNVRGFLFGQFTEDKSKEFGSIVFHRIVLVRCVGVKMFCGKESHS